MSAVLEAVPLETLEASAAVIYATDPELRLIYANPSWDRFAKANRGSHLVRSRLTREPLLDAMRGPLREFYTERFAQALQAAKPVEHAFECSSPQLKRTFHMRILPLRNKGLLVINSLAAEEPMPSAAAPAGGEYLDHNGLITMCSHCRRTQRTDVTRWEWVPAFVEQQPEQVSHGLCPVCLEYHYLSARRAHV
jgi:PAS domain-containing protein